MSTEVEMSTADALAAVSALESQLGQAHADLLLAQADAETLRALRALLIEWGTSDGTSGFMDADERLAEMAHALAAVAREHPGQSLADEVAAARAVVAVVTRLDGNGTTESVWDELWSALAAYDAAVQAGTR